MAYQPFVWSWFKESVLLFVRRVPAYHRCVWTSQGYSAALEIAYGFGPHAGLSIGFGREVCPPSAAGRDTAPRILNF